MGQETTREDVDLDTLKARTVSGIVTLVSRSFFLQIVATVGFFALSVFLGRPEIGLFIAVNDLVAILGYFSDIGLAASLIQKKAQPTLADLRTTFTIQQSLVLALVLAMSLLAGPLFAYYHITGAGTSLYYALLLAFFLASLKTVPSVLLERRLHFQVLAAVEIVENLIFYAVAVALAWRGWGIAAYVWAVTLRGLVGTVMIYILSPWPVGLSFSVASLKSLLSFGLPYQINTLIATVKDRFINIFLWKIIGADGIGIIGWAQTWSGKPLRFIMDNVTKVTFPAFSRLQDHPDELRRGIERTLFYICLATFPVLALLSTLAPLAVRLIPRYSKWEAALLPLVIYCFNSALAGVSTPLTNTLNALGKVKVNTYLMIMWTALTWALTPALAVKYGYLGVAYATGLIALSSIVPVIIVRRLTRFSLLNSIAKPALAAIIMTAASYFMSHSLSLSLSNLLLNAFLSAALFAVTIYLLVGPSLLADARKFRHVLAKKS